MIQFCFCTMLIASVLFLNFTFVYKSPEQWLGLSKFNLVFHIQINFHKVKYFLFLFLVTFWFMIYCPVKKRMLAYIGLSLHACACIHMWNSHPIGCLKLLKLNIFLFHKILGLLLLFFFFLSFNLSQLAFVRKKK